MLDSAAGNDKRNDVSHSISDLDDDNSDSDAGGEDDLENAQAQLKKIELKIKKGGMSKRERRLLQNRKSALKCRIKKDQETYRVRSQLANLTKENIQLKE